MVTMRGRLISTGSCISIIINCRVPRHLLQQSHLLRSATISVTFPDDEKRKCLFYGRSQASNIS